MNKELAAALKLKLTNVPFIGVLAGLVQTVETEDFVEQTNAKVIKRFPVSTDILGQEDCKGRERDLVPDSSKGSIIYFEDFGSRVVDQKHSYTDFVSNLRLICWMNRKILTGDEYQEITAYCILAIQKRICNQNPKTLGIFTRLIVSAAAIPQQNAALFNRYTYDEKLRQYLRPPFEFFGMDLVCKYRVANSCIPSVTFINEKTC